jgi:hypothetical protein
MGEAGGPELWNDFTFTHGIQRPSAVRSTSRRLPSEGRGREFESRRARHDFKGLASLGKSHLLAGKQWVSKRQKSGVLIQCSSGATGSPPRCSPVLASDRATLTPLSPPLPRHLHQGANRRIRHHPPGGPKRGSAGRGG